MEKRIIRNGLKRLGLAGILGASLMFGGIGVKEANAQSHATWANTMNYWGNDPKTSPKDREIYRQSAYVQGLYADGESERKAKEMKEAIEKNNRLLEDLKGQQGNKLEQTSKNSENNYVSKTNPEVYQDNLFYDKPDFFSCNEWIDKDKDGFMEPKEIVGFGKKVFKKGENITIIVKTTKKEGVSLIYETYKDKEERPLFRSNLSVLRDYGTSIYFSTINPEPGKYVTIFKQNNCQVGLVEFRVE